MTIKSNRRTLQAILIPCLLGISWSLLNARIALNGTVEVFPYAGAQPHLIDGVSSVPITDRPLIRHVYMAGPDVMGIVIDEKACILSNIKPYRKQAGDTLVKTGYHGLSELLVRNGDSLGYFCGRENKWYRPFNEYAGEKLDTAWIAGPSHYTVFSPNDPVYKNGKNPVDIFRKSRPKESVTRVRISPKPIGTLRHFIYLKLPAALTPGNHYEVRFLDYPGDFQRGFSFLFTDDGLRSEAVHVNLYGYAPDGPKIALLSCWMGDGGALTFPDDLNFRVVDLADKKTAFKGPVKLKQAAGVPEYIIDKKAYNHNKTHVYAMDFSSLRKKGTYKLVVEGIGCSFDFVIDSGVWENTTRLLMKGFLHQRAGIELGPPYTGYIRPRNLHPADGHTIHKCDPEKFFHIKGSHFGPIRESLLENTSVPDAWGGWMDAGDYDRRMSHFYSVRRMMLLYEMNPGYFERLDLNIPESVNNIPDILDEARWCLDLFKRTQGVYEEGAVSWWIESIEHPRQGETSWLNSLPTALVPPTPEACINYAGAAAHMALLLKKYDAPLAAEYERSALDAMKWVREHPDAPVLYKRRVQKDLDCITFIHLYRLTGEKIWHQRFKRDLDERYPKGIDGHLEYHKLEAVTIYALMARSQVDRDLQDRCRTAVVSFADELLKGAEEVTYFIPRLRSHHLSRLSVFKSKILPIAAAHDLTGKPKYIETLAKTIQYTMGMNPMNRSTISGLGERSFMPYHHDWHTANSAIPAGIPNFGPVIYEEKRPWDIIGHQWSDVYVRALETVYEMYPDKLIDWPMPEACFNQMWATPVNEFMVETPMGELLMLSGYLASHK